MMEEVSMMMARDGHVIDQMSEEEIIACLVAETGPTSTVPTKKAKLGESRLQMMTDEEDPMDKYLKENKRLQQTSLRLEQENDNLAHRLITSKIALRNSLDKAEDKVDELIKDLLQTRRRLQTTENEKKNKEEEAAMLKEVFRRELEKADEEMKKSSGIIADYKQICSQLALRLERQQATHREEMELIKSTVKTCSHCQHVTQSITSGFNSESEQQTKAQELSESHREETARGPRKEDKRKEDQEAESFRVQIRELERELAQTKLQMVEAKCKIQELEHQKTLLANDLQEAKNNWISKAFTSLRTSSGDIHSINMPKTGAPPVDWNLNRNSHPGWSSKKLLWPHRERRGNL